MVFGDCNLIMHQSTKPFYAPEITTEFFQPLDIDKLRDLFVPTTSDISIYKVKLF